MSFTYVKEIDSTFVIEKYRKWLAPCDPSTNHHSATEKHHFGTGTWLLHQLYMNWKKDPNSFMWIHGICEQNVKLKPYATANIILAGAGKTVVL